MEPSQLTWNKILTILCQQSGDEGKGLSSTIPVLTYLENENIDRPFWCEKMIKHWVEIKEYEKATIFFVKMLSNQVEPTDSTLNEILGT
eukprot:Pgem_evm1s12699